MCPALRELNGEKLKSIANANHTAEVIVTHLALRQRNRKFIDVSRMQMMLRRNGEQIDEKDCVALFKAWQEEGIGIFRAGRGVNPDIFDLRYDLKIVAKASIEGKNLNATEHLNKPKAKTVKPAAKVVTLKAAPKASKTVETSQNEKIVHIYLRSNYMVQLKVPADFSKEEAKRLCQSVNAISE